MPIKRRAGKELNFSITDEAVELFAYAMSIRQADGDLEWEEDAGKRHEFLNVCGKLHDMLGLQLWDLPVTSDNAHMDPVTWPLREALEEALIQDRARGSLVRSIAEGLSEAREAKTLIKRPYRPTANGHQRKRA